MNSITDLVSCWRYGVFYDNVRRIQRILRFLLLSAVSYFLFVEKIFLDKLISGDSVLIDVLLGFPLIVALLVVFDIVVLGVFKTVACILGWVTMPHIELEK